MEIWGLTGGMASGKSKVAALFRRAGVPVFDSDACVHRLQGEGGAALPAIERAFPGVVQNNKLNRQELRMRLMNSPQDLKLLEGILHPLIAQERQIFLRRAQARRVALVVLDVPLLWESGCDKICDRILVTIAPLSLRLQRIMQRQRQGHHQGKSMMTVAEARYLMDRQISDAERCRKADIILRTGLSHAFIERQVKRLLHSFRSFQ